MLERVGGPRNNAHVADRLQQEQEEEEAAHMHAFAFPSVGERHTFQNVATDETRMTLRAAAGRDPARMR